MNTTKTIVDQLINASGFSRTYERERLDVLVKLTAKYCIETYLNDKNVERASDQLLNEFNVTPFQGISIDRQNSP